MDGEPEGLEYLIASAGQEVRDGAHLPGDGDVDFHKAQSERGDEGYRQPQDAGQKALDYRFRQELCHHVAVRPAHCFEHTDLACPLGDVARHGFEGDEDGDNNRDERCRHGELVGQGEEAAEELEKRFGCPDCRVLAEDAAQGGCQTGNLLLVRLDEKEVDVSRVKGGDTTAPGARQRRGSALPPKADRHWPPLSSPPVRRRSFPPQGTLFSPPISYRPP